MVFTLLSSLVYFFLLASRLAQKHRILLLRLSRKTDSSLTVVHQRRKSAKSDTLHHPKLPHRTKSSLWARIETGLMLRSYSITRLVLSLLPLREFTEREGKSYCPSHLKAGRKFGFPTTLFTRTRGEERRAKAKPTIGRVEERH